MELPRIIIKGDVLRNIDRAKKLEWIITNGLGGYASSTVLGMNTRKYHGLLIATSKPPMDRKLVLAAMDKEILVGDKTLGLSTNRYVDVIHPQGYRFLKRFELGTMASFFWCVENVSVRESVFLPYRKNMLILFYRVKTNGKKIVLRLRPLINFRSIYGLSKHIRVFEETNRRQGFKIRFGNDEFISMKCNKGRYLPSMLKVEKKWYYNFFYEKDHERGEDCVENCYNPGTFEIKIRNDSTFYVIASYCCEMVIEPEELLKNEVKRKKEVLNGFFKLNKHVQQDDWVKWLVLAMDSHRIRRYDGKPGIIAGYHWFGEWGRDTLISIPALLVMGKSEEVRDILERFSKECKAGLMPNMLPTSTRFQPSYNSVDTSLWFINSVYTYFNYTKDLEFVKKIWGKLKSIIDHYMCGTNGIKMDSDSLIEHSPGLTWMDAKVGKEFVTPRAGKAVEIEALWYNSLRVMEFFAKKLKDKDSKKYGNLAERVKKNFEKRFWNGKYLNDCADDSTLRPNQLIALSLPFRIIDARKAKSILESVKDGLFTEYGIRTLPRNNPQFQGKYFGSLGLRDRAYHQGSIWPWLSALFMKAWMRYMGSKENLEKKVKTWVMREIRRFGLGTLPEILDGDEPFCSRGCISQAWSIAMFIELVSDSL